MMKLLIFLVFLIGTVVGDSESGLQNFINEAMLNFDEWIAAQGLDPTPPLAREFNMSFNTGLFHINGTLNDVSLFGLSNNIKEAYSSRSSFLNRYISLYIYVEWSGLRGTYNASGSVLDAYPISGQDTWSVSSDPFRIQFESNFRLEDGYIVLLDNEGWPYAEFDVFSNMEAAFNNLFTPETVGYEGEITAIISSRLALSVFGQEGAQVWLYDVHIRNYLQSLFSVTPASEIISWPDPFTTPYPEPTSTELYTTTYNPCGNGKKADIRSEGLNNFLMYSFRNFGDWLIENGLDPTLPVTTPADISIDSSFLKLNGTFRFTTALGLSKNTYFWYADSDFIVPQFSFWMQMYNMTIYGLYDAEGSIISTYPISGEGMWTLSNFHLDMSFHIAGFGIDNGFINIDEFIIRDFSLNPSTGAATLSMPDLVRPDDADGLGKEVLDVLMEVIPRELNLQDKHPVPHAILDYLKVIFAETPLSEIIATTRPPGCVEG